MSATEQKRPWRTDYKLSSVRDDPDEKPCPSCGRYGTTVGGVHPILGMVCDGCWSLLHEPIMPGMMPVAFLEGWPYRSRRPRGQG